MYIINNIYGISYPKYTYIDTISVIVMKQLNKHDRNVNTNIPNKIDNSIIYTHKPLKLGADNCNI